MMIDGTLILAGEAAASTVGAAVAGWWARRGWRRWRYRRVLASIARLEVALGIMPPPRSDWAEAAEALADRHTPAARDYVEVVRSPYTTSAAVRDSRRPPRDVGAPEQAPRLGYQGPALTDADVRRLEHPEEFPP